MIVRQLRKAFSRISKSEEDPRKELKGDGEKNISVRLN